ncbi:hypothetical protein TNCV_4520621 [Trichonephila clavipes]|nr:hypothetical protein TNCV_4520621 [Trichonephila clavipes]
MVLKVKQKSCHKNPCPLQIQRRKVRQRMRINAYAERRREQQQTGVPEVIRVRIMMIYKREADNMIDNGYFWLNGHIGLVCTASMRAYRLCMAKRLCLVK